jgi:hypothetical protein
MTGAELAIAHRQLAIRTHALVKHLHVAWTAHGFETQRACAGRVIRVVLCVRAARILSFGQRIHVGTEFFPMAAALPDRAGEQLRRADFAEARATHSPANVVFQHAI